MKKLLKIDCVMYRVSDLESAAVFYSETLGLKQVWKDDEAKMIGFIFPGGDSEVVIHSNPDIPNPDFCFLVENVEEFAKDFKEKGYKVCKEPFHVRTGKFAVLADPDGNIINIIDLTKFGGVARGD